MAHGLSRDAQIPGAQVAWATNFFGEVLPVTRHDGPERKYSLLFNLGAKWTVCVQGQAPAALALGKKVGIHHGRPGRTQKILPPRGFDPRTVQPVASHTNYAVPAYNILPLTFIGPEYGTCFKSRFRCPECSCSS
jgi:hypothetical protein